MDANLTLEGVINFLLRTSLFADLEPAELGELVKIMQVQHLKDGESVFNEGDEGDGWYVIFEGGGRVSKASAHGPDREIAVLAKHACFGEMAVLDGSARSAAVSAAGATVLFRFPRVPFQDLLHDGHLAAFKLVWAMARVLCERQRNITEQLSDALDGRVGEAVVVKPELGEMVDRASVSE